MKTEAAARVELTGTAGRRAGRMARLKEQRYLFLLLLPGVAWVLVFAYAPMFGLYMAFVDYQPSLGNFWSSFFTSRFVGFEWFSYFFNSGDFALIMRNTIASSLITLLFAFPAPILIALALNEIKGALFKRSVQTVSYLPHFISWVIAANILVTVLASDGVVNRLLMAVGLTNDSILFLQKGELFWWIVALGNTWKDMGFNAIIYLAAIASINPELYEAAKIDGAGRFAQIRYITFPFMKPTIVILLILSVGGILNTGFDQYFLLGNDMNRQFSDVVDTYSFRYGLQQGMFSYGAAVGLFKAVVAFIMVFAANQIAKKLQGQSLF